MYTNLEQIKNAVNNGIPVYYRSIDYNYRKTKILSEENLVISFKNGNFIICSESGTELDYLSDWWDNNKLNNNYSIENFYS